MALAVRLEPETVAVAPGAGGAWTVAILNNGTSPVACRVAVAAEGEVAAWFWVAQPELTVAPGETAAVRIGARVPPGPARAPGKLPFSVEVGTDAEQDPVACEGAVDVVAVVDVTASLGPRSDRHGRRYPISVRNRGNTPARVSLSGGGGTSVEPGSLVVGPGEDATAILSAAGRPGARFDVDVRPEGGAASVVSGTVERDARRRIGWPVGVAIAAAVLVLAGVLVGRVAGSGDGPTTTAVAAPVIPVDCPLHDHLASEANGRDRPGVDTPVRYSFLDARPGGCQPVRFNPCEPVHYVVNSTLAPPGGLADLSAAVAQLSAATGMTFVNDGPSDEPPSANRVTYQPQRYGQEWAPILVVWAHGDAYRLNETTPGGGRATAFGGVYVSGILILNVDAVTDKATHTPLADGFGEGATWGRVMIHELGHLVGLGHVRSPAEVMFTELGAQRGQAEYHSGDLEGLGQLGAQAGCLTPPAPPAPRP